MLNLREAKGRVPKGQGQEPAAISAAPEGPARTSSLFSNLNRIKLRSYKEGSMALILIAISFVLGLLCLKYFRDNDYYEREPSGLMALLTLVGGVLSITIAGGLEVALKALSLTEIPKFAHVMLFTGPCEEFSKLIVFLGFAMLFRKRIREPVDGMVYIGCVALGFSLIENIFYAANHHTTLLFMRFFVSTPMHICFSSIMGFAYANSIGKRHFIVPLLRAYLLASLAHSLFDGLTVSGLNNGNMMLLVLVSFYLWSKRVLGYSLVKSPQRRPLQDYLTTHSGHAVNGLKFCPACSAKTEQVERAINGAKMFSCSKCGWSYTTSKGFSKVMDFFAPSAALLMRKNKDIEKQISESAPEVFDSEYKPFRKFQLDRCNALFESLAQTVVSTFEAKKTFNFVYNNEPLITSADMATMGARLKSEETRQGLQLMGILIGMGLMVAAIVYCAQLLSK